MEKPKDLFMLGKIRKKERKNAKKGPGLA